MADEITHDAKSYNAKPGEALPSITEIDASNELLSSPDASAKVVRVRGYAAKYGTTVSLLEARNLDYLSTIRGLPFVAKPYGTLEEERTGRKFIIMEYIESETMEKIWSSLDGADKAAICRQLREAVSQLRSIPAPGYIGSVDGKRSPDGLFCVPSSADPRVSGPFDDEDTMNEGMLRRLAETESGTYIAFLRTLVTSSLHDHQICFTHGDLQAKNIMVRRSPSRQPRLHESVLPSGGIARDDSDTNAAINLEIKIIDWEYAGWYPEYWDFCSAAFAARFKPAWTEVVTDVLDLYAQEYLMMQMLRTILFA